MTIYRFHIRQELSGYIDIDIGDQDPDYIADELERENGSNFNIMYTETEIPLWDNLGSVK